MKARRESFCSWCCRPIRIGDDIEGIAAQMGGPRTWLHAACAGPAEDCFDGDPDDYAAIHADVGDR